MLCNGSSLAGCNVDDNIDAEVDDMLLDPDR